MSAAFSASSARVISARFTAWFSASGFTGLTRYSAAPFLMARTAGSTLSSAVMTTTSTPGYRSRVCWRTSIPSPVGRMRSVTTRSTG